MLFRCHMTDSFTQFEREFGTLTADLIRRISSEIPNATGDVRRGLIRRAQQELREVQELVTSMDLELREIVASERTKYKNRVTSYKAEAERIERDLRKAEISVDGGMAARDELLRHDELTTSLDQRQAYASSTQRISRTSEKLVEGQRMLQETTEMGANVMVELDRQGKVIEGASNKVHDVDSSLARSMRLLKSMSRRLVQNKVLLFGIIFVLIGIIFLALFFKFFYNSDS
ncbi:hypothetical protein CAOG_000756 [Capsaspora owczarzaki ATCC 30864]|uniref:t-SNARE coiled-coil homology domain-containing protein n=3 Tax=Capsaspora owczarzaki (strain ATCC 30864) TaxID=595528 RepID=A0A0D2X0L0_CAPO3|nr:hypothetical protein CAOG_000756 [Capsaspora owczarzaki ATCC 30864]